MVLYDSFWRNGYFLLEHVFEKHQSLPKTLLKKTNVPASTIQEHTNNKYIRQARGQLMFPLDE